MIFEVTACQRLGLAKSGIQYSQDLQETKRDHPMETFIEQAVKEYKDSIKSFMSSLKVNVFL